MSAELHSPHKGLSRPFLAENWTGSTWIQRGVLAVLFTMSFALPVMFGLRIASSWFTREQQVAEDTDLIFPKNIPVQSQGAYLRVADSDVLTPEIDKDYIFVAWFNLKRVPKAGEDMTLFSKIDQQNRFRPGYSLSLSRTGNLVRPLLYWKDDQGRGGLYRFSEVRISPRSWFGFVLSLRKNDLLGLHIINLEAGKSPMRELLGGFKLSVPVFPKASAPLFVGAIQGGTFRGKLGPIEIFSGNNLNQSFKDTLKQIGKNPLSVPRSIDTEDVALWCPDGLKDRSAHQHQISRSQRALRSESGA